MAAGLGLSADSGARTTSRNEIAAVEWRPKPGTEVTFLLPSSLPVAERLAAVVVYRDRSGREPFSAWFNELDRHAAAKVAAALARLEQGNLAEVKSVGGGVFERRIDWGPGYRLYFGRDGLRLIVLLCGGTKKRQQRDIETAQARWADYSARRNA